MSLSASLSAVGASASTIVRPGQTVAYAINGGFVGTIIGELLVKGTGGPTVPLVNALGTTVSVTAPAGGFYKNESKKNQNLRFSCSAYTSGTAVCTVIDGPIGDDAAFDSRYVGLPSGAQVMAIERGSVVANRHQTTLLFANLPLTLADATVGAGVKAYTFPEGRINVQGAVGSIFQITTSVLASTLNASVTCNWGMGTTTQASATLATTEQDILPSTALTASATINVAGAASNAKLAAAAQFDGTTTAKDVYLNVAIATATDIDGDATVLITGFATITWDFLGDY